MQNCFAQFTATVPQSTVAVPQSIVTLPQSTAAVPQSVVLYFHFIVIIVQVFPKGDSLKKFEDEMNVFLKLMVL